MIALAQRAWSAWSRQPVRLRGRCGQILPGTAPARQITESRVMPPFRLAGRLAGAALAVLSLSPALAAPASYETLVKAYFADHFRAHPSDATSEGLHDYD